MLDGFSPAQIGRFDQERADVRATLQRAIDALRDYREGHPDLSVDDLWIALVREFTQLEHVRLLAFFTEALMRLAQDGEVWS